MSFLVSGWMSSQSDHDEPPHTRSVKIFLGTVTPPSPLPQVGGVPMTQPQPASTLIEYVLIGDLTPHPRNARQGDIGAIITSIEKNGWFGTIVAQKSTKYILAGNHRYAAAKQMGMTHLPVYWVDCDDDRALAILVADNRLSDLGTYDNQALLDILSDVSDANMLLETGYDEEDLARMLREDPTPKEPQERKMVTCPSCGEKFNAAG